MCISPEGDFTGLRLIIKIIKQNVKVTPGLICSLNNVGHNLKWSDTPKGFFDLGQLAQKKELVDEFSRRNPGTVLSERK